MTELNKIGIAGPEYLRETLTNCSDPLKAIEEFQEQNSILLPSLKPALHFLDLHSINRVDFHTSVVDVLREALIKQITDVHENEPESERMRKLNEMLDKSFLVIRDKKLQPVAMHIMKFIPEIKKEYLSEIEKDEELYKAAPREAKRQIWQGNQSLFGDEVSPILNSYIKSKRTLLFDHKTRKNFFNLSPKVRRSDEFVQQLVDMIGHNIDLYDMTLQFLRTLYLRTRNIQYCTLRSDILMALHEQEVNDICSMDPSHKFAWCLDACIREHFVDNKRAKELQGFLDGIKKGQEEVLGDLAMVLADPYALHTCCQTLLKLLHTSASGENLPRANGDYILIFRMIQLGLNAWTMMDTANFKEPKLSHKLITQFLPAIESLMVDEQIRSHSQRLPDAVVESAEDIPSTLHKTITDNETAAYIMVYYASHAINSKEILLYVSVLDALKHEGDVAYCDTLLHNLVNDIATHIDFIMAANNLVYIVDMFFGDKMNRDSTTHHLLRLFWLIQRKVSPPIMLELLARINIEGQDDVVCNMYKSLQEVADSAGPPDTSMSMDVDMESPLSSVPMPTPMYTS
ncbi:negative elongation factor B-like isoform X2 [Watersipora subatra]|uniref:negative elongation factor B-like isoform X2 n=1 Tax=Watersipora subatra TaxID=2589382 RepID=UPI00355C4604